MVERNGVSPKMENLGQPCMWWSNKDGCTYPKAEMKGLTACSGTVSIPECPLVVPREMRRQSPN
ncbi:MAG TPA: hypothetical protein VLF93_01200 [Candidatus Saccharimonadales bacterium]|nr:hypothetical protein [Candidatus Saccharimonadales bacterium]